MTLAAATVVNCAAAVFEATISQSLQAATNAVVTCVSVHDSQLNKPQQAQQYTANFNAVHI
jgi:hypothetical protein